MQLFHVEKKWNFTETHVTGCFIECFKKKLMIVYESNARKKIKFKVGQNLINLESLSIGIEILIITNLTLVGLGATTNNSMYTTTRVI